MEHPGGYASGRLACARRVDGGYRINRLGRHCRVLAILAAWQMPHFLALAWMYRKDYERGGYAMLPVADPSGRSTTRQTLFFTILLFALSLWPVALSLTGWGYAIGAVVLGAWFLHAALVFHRSREIQDARRVLNISIRYIPGLILVLLVDRIVLGNLF